MKKTKQNIIAASVDLFNSRGLNEVTMRDIAAALNMSPGNLTYHYPSKEMLMLSIYEVMFQEMEGRVKPEGSLSLVHVQHIIQHAFSFHDRYRFYFMDIVDVTKTYPALAKRQAKVNEKRWEEGFALVQHLVEQGLLNKEPYTECYQNLTHSIMFHSLFARPYAELFNWSETKIFSQLLLKWIFNLIRPHTTQKGLKELKQLGYAK